jgi:hypothetical protein
MLIATAGPQAMLPERNMGAISWLNLPANRPVRTACIDYAGSLVVQGGFHEPQRQEEHQERREMMLFAINCFRHEILLLLRMLCAFVVLTSGLQLFRARY